MRMGSKNYYGPRQHNYLVCLYFQVRQHSNTHHSVLIIWKIIKLCQFQDVDSKITNTWSFLKLENQHKPYESTFHSFERVVDVGYTTCRLMKWQYVQIKKWLCMHFKERNASPSEWQQSLFKILQVCTQW